MAFRASLDRGPATMTFRTRLLLIFTVALVALIWLVEWVVLVQARHAFERSDTQRVEAVIAQFRKEFDRRREEIALAVKGIAESDAVINIAIAADYAPYVGEAASLAKTRGL